MLKSYFKVAFRNLVRHKSFSVFNIAGLAVGLATFILIALWVFDELSYDRFHEKSDRIFRALLKTDSKSEPGYARTAPLLGPTLRNDFPEVEHAIRLKRSSITVRRDTDLFQEENFFYAEPEVFDVFTLPLLSGNNELALQEPYSVVLSEEMAIKYFGRKDPLGEFLVLSDSTLLKITGVMKNYPGNSHLQIDFVASFATWQQYVPDKWMNTWRSGIYYTYVLLTPGHSPADLEHKFAASKIKKDYGSKEQLFIDLQPLESIHLGSHLKHELQANGNALYVSIFSAVAVLVLLIACINFMNLATARSSRRMREIGVRKVMGGRRSQVVRQFLCESLTLSVLSLLVAILMVQLALPYFNAFAGKDLSLAIGELTGLTFDLIGLAVLVGLISGSYPAIFLSSFQPVHVLKGRLDQSGLMTSSLIRKSLIVFQFVISIALLVGTAVVYRQLQYIRNQNLGFNQEQILVIPFLWDAGVQAKYESFKGLLTQNTGVLNVTASGDIPGRMMTGMTYQVEGMAEEEWGGITALIVDPDFAETYGLQMIAGRDFSDEMQTDVRNTFILNEAAVKEIGWHSAEEAIGKRFRMNEEGQIIGVVRDFNFNSLHSEIEPLVMAVWPSWFGYLSVKLTPGDLAEELDFVEQAWFEFNPSQPFNAFFFDQHFEQLYQADRQFGQVITVFAILALFIAALGLFGLLSFTVEQRTKEIGVRKVVGASVGRIIALLSGEFAKLVLLAGLISSPIAWLGITKWLEGFAYRTAIEPWLFVVAAGVTLSVALLTISWQTYKAASANPVRALRYE